MTRYAVALIPALLIVPAAMAAGASGTKATASTAAGALPTVVTYKDPSCGCCGNWIEHMRQHGFKVEAENRSDMAAVKARLGVPMSKASCHTSKVGGLVVEGHVPAEDVIRLLKEKRTGVIGLTAPGMPMGSPGMEMPDGRKQAYTVELIKADGTTVPYAHH